MKFTLVFDDKVDCDPTISKIEDKSTQEDSEKDTKVMFEIVKEEEQALEEEMSHNDEEEEDDEDSEDEEECYDNE